MSETKVASSYAIASVSIGVFIYPDISNMIIPFISNIGSDVQIVVGVVFYSIGCFMNK